MASGLDQLLARPGAARAEPQAGAAKVKRCPVCKVVLTQRPDERPYNFRQRMTCSRRCAGLWKRPPLTGERRCANPDCGKPLMRREGETQLQFLNRKSCNYSCGTKAGYVTRKLSETCPFCSGRRRKRSPKGKLYPTCGHPECREAAQEASPSYGSEEIHWPVITGEIDWHNAFSAHNRDPGDGGVFRLRRPDARSYTMSTAAWLIRDAVS